MQKKFSNDIIKYLFKKGRGEMLKLRKKLFLILSMVGVILCLVSCIPDGYIKLKFDEELYTIKVGETNESSYRNRW